MDEFVKGLEMLDRTTKCCDYRNRMKLEDKAVSLILGSFPPPVINNWKFALKEQLKACGCDLAEDYL